MSNSSNNSIPVPSISSSNITQPEFALRTTQAVLITLSNLFVLLVFYRIKKWTFSNLLFVSLSVSDLMAGCVTLPLSIVSTKFSVWPLGSFMCVVQQLTRFSQMRVSNQTVVVLSLHRFIQLFKPFQAEERLSWRKMIALTICWLFPYSFAISMLIAFYLTGNFKIATCALITPSLFLVMYAVLIDLTPSLISVSVNLYNTYGLYMKYRKTAASTQSVSRHLKTSANEDNSSSLACSSRSDVNKPNGANAKILKTRRDLRAALCISAIIFNVLVTEYPLSISALFFAFNPVVAPVFVLSSKIVYFFPLLNPIILFIFNTNFQQKSKETVLLLARPFRRTLTRK